MAVEITELKRRVLKRIREVSVCGSVDNRVMKESVKEDSRGERVWQCR